MVLIANDGRLLNNNSKDCLTSTTMEASDRRGRVRVRSIFDITERNEESEFTGGNKSLHSNIFNRDNSKNRQWNRCTSQTFRFSNLSNNLLSQNNIETEMMEAGCGIAHTLETERHSIPEEK